MSRKATIIWIGESIPEWVEMSRRAWGEYAEVNLRNVPRIVAEEKFPVVARLGQLCLLADMLKYETLAQNGGVVLDADVRPGARAKEVVDLNADWLVSSPLLKGAANNWMLGAAKSGSNWPAIYSTMLSASRWDEKGNKSLMMCGRNLPRKMLSKLPQEMFAETFNQTSELLQESINLQIAAKHYCMDGRTEVGQKRGAIVY